MTPFSMPLPNIVDLQPNPPAERPSAAKSAEEDSRRFQEALQRAESRNADAGRPPPRECAGESRCPRESDHRPEPPAPREGRNAPEVREPERVEPSEAGTRVETESPRETRESGKGSGRSRNARKADDGWEGIFQLMPGMVISVAGSPAPVAAGQPLPSFPGQPFQMAGGMGGQPAGVVAGGEMALAGSGAAPGQMGGVFALRPEGLVAATAPGGGEGVSAPLLQGAGGEKGDFAMALRVVSSGENAASRPEAASRPSTLSTYSPLFGDELADQAGQLRVISRPGSSEQVRITLHPRDLGSLDMRLVVDEQQQVHLMITAESDAAREAINRHMPQLREALARQNLGMGEVTVHVDDGQGGNSAPEWGFQGGNAARHEEGSGGWRGSGMGRGAVTERAPEAVAARPVSPGVGGGSGLSLFA